MYNPYQYPQQPFYNGGAMPDQLSQLRGNYMQQNQPNMQPPQQAAPSINFVNGEQAAREWMVTPGSTVFLMDNNGSSFYLKSVDASGMPQPLRIFDFTERAATPQKAPEAAGNNFVTREEYNALAARVDALTVDRAPKAKKTVKEDADNA